VKKRRRKKVVQNSAEGLWRKTKEGAQVRSEGREGKEKEQI
jgi:hypothetical protein